MLTNLRGRRRLVEAREVAAAWHPDLEAGARRFARECGHAFANGPLEISVCELFLNRAITPVTWLNCPPRLRLRFTMDARGDVRLVGVVGEPMPGRQSPVSKAKAEPHDTGLVLSHGM